MLLMLNYQWLRFMNTASGRNKENTIINLADDISQYGCWCGSDSSNFGTQYLGVEVPNDQRESVTIKELLSDQNFKSTTHKIPICIGKDISGNIEVIDLSKTPHLLVAEPQVLESQFLLILYLQSLI